MHEKLQDDKGYLITFELKMVHVPAFLSNKSVSSELHLNKKGPSIIQIMTTKTL